MSTCPSRTDFVHATLRSELRSGGRRPGSPISVKETAERMGVSHTPVREALERLVGEGLVVPTGSKAGFQLVRLGHAGLIQAIDLHAMLATAAHARIRGRALTGPPLPLEVDPIVATEAAFATIFLERANAQIATSAARVSGLLACYRAREPALFPDWHSELTLLVGAMTGSKDVAGAVRAYHRRRASRAADLISACEELG